MSELQDLQDLLRRSGFVECDIPECNCGSWHQVHGWPERFREIDDATREFYRNGETLLGRIERMVRQINEHEAIE